MRTAEAAIFQIYHLLVEFWLSTFLKEAGVIFEPKQHIDDGEVAKLVNKKYARRMYTPVFKFLVDLTPRTLTIWLVGSPEGQGVRPVTQDASRHVYTPLHFVAFFSKSAMTKLE